MKTYTGWQYMLIDLANHFGKDKLLFEDRIKWAEVNLHHLETLADQAETKPLYVKAVQAIRAAQAGKPTGHLVGFDGVCSGIQMMSVITGCKAGAYATGLVDPNFRADAYSLTTEHMNQMLSDDIAISRADAKRCLMTSFYGSRKVPEQVFGDGTEELDVFYQAAEEVAPGPWELLQDLLASWQPFTLEHRWKLPDGFDARVKVMEKLESRIEVDELDHATFTYEFYENIGAKKGLSNAANVVHSIDAYVLRSIHRRCNYDLNMVNMLYVTMKDELEDRESIVYSKDGELATGKLAYYVEQYVRSGIADVVIFPHITKANVHQLSQDHLEKLFEIASEMIDYVPFPVITIHDEFKCHPNNMNHLRQQYINILADLADSEIISDILSQIVGIKDTWRKKSKDLSTLIKGSNYALC